MTKRLEADPGPMFSRASSEQTLRTETVQHEKYLEYSKIKLCLFRDVWQEESQPLFCRKSLFTFTPGSCSVQPQSFLPTRAMLLFRFFPPQTGATTSNPRAHFSKPSGNHRPRGQMYWLYSNIKTTADTETLISTQKYQKYKLYIYLHIFIYCIPTWAYYWIQ